MEGRRGRKTAALASLEIGKSGIFITLALNGIVLAALYLSSFYSYLLFHSLIEFVTIVIAFALLVLTWNTRKYFANSFLKILGIGYAFCAGIDLMHTLAYKGVHIFADGPNLPTQLWIAARCLQAACLVLALLLRNRRVHDAAITAGFSAATVLLLTAVFRGYFPDCFIEGKGLTEFKIRAEYVISAVLIVSLIALYRSHRQFEGRVELLIRASIVCTILSELSFTQYASVFGPANMVGHYFKLAAFYFVYRSIVVTGIKEPFALVFRDLKQTQEALSRSVDVLEERVQERTSDLQLANRRLEEELIERRRAEEQIRYLASIVKSTDDAVIGKTLDGNIVSWNRGAERIYGYTAEEMVGGSISVLIPSERRGELDSILDRLRKGDKIEHLETRRTRKDGRVIDVSLTISPMKDGEKCSVGASTIARDITERKLAEESLRRLNRELRALSECNEVLVRASDEQRLLNEICRIVCERAGYRMAWVGYRQGDEEKTVRAVACAGVDQGDLEGAHSVWADTESGRGPVGISIRTGKSVTTQGFAGDADVSPWRARAQERGYRSFLSLPLKNEGGAAFGALVIYSVETDAFTPEEVRLLEELAADLAFGITVLRGRSYRERAEEALRASEAELRELNIQLERKVEERTVDLAQRTVQLEAANQELESFNSAIAHDLRSPLRHIRGFAELLKEEAGSALNADALRYVSNIRHSVDRMSNLVDDLLRLSRLGKQELRVQNYGLRGLLDDVIEELRPAMEGRNIQWHIDDLPSCECDPCLFRQVLTNLVSNAVKFTRERNPAVIEIGKTVVSGELAMFVRDNGAGFDMKYYDTLFGVFHRLHRQEEFEGTGIGLAIVQRIMHRHGGRVWAEAELNKGATFYLSLPSRGSERQ